jgi:hypothetical protein
LVAPAEASLAGVLVVFAAVVAALDMSAAAVVGAAPVFAAVADVSAVGAVWLLIEVAEVVELALEPVVSAAEAEGPVLPAPPALQWSETSVTLLT